MHAAATDWSKDYASHLSVILCFIAGPFCDNLYWPFRGDLEVHQVNDTVHHSGN